MKIANTELLAAQKERAAISKKISELDKKISVITKKVISDFCPHKVGDPVYIKRNKSSIPELMFCCSIRFYNFSEPMKFSYEFSKKFDPNGFNYSEPLINPIVEWITK